jgi:hypothetical protein
VNVVGQTHTPENCPETNKTTNGEQTWCRTCGKKF